jgi:GTP-binding protein
MKVPPFKNAALEATAHVIKQLPSDGLPEIALAGRSNVGKSSLINSLAGRKDLARTSSSPGKTRSINFYKIDEQWYLVDLPGYGYARASKESRNAWNQLIESYLSQRPPLRAVLHLIDIRHPPMPNDHLMQEWLRFHGTRCRVVATKADKIPRGKRLQSLRLIQSELRLENEVIPFSTVTGEGWEELARLLSLWVRENPASD